MINKTRIFLTLSITIAVIDGLFVLMNNTFSTTAFEENLKQEGQRLHASFNTLMSQTYANMLTMATFVANDKEVQRLFLAGKKAVEAEGSGPGGQEAANIRKKLFNKVGPNWREVQKKFKVRQLHFHLGPGSTSFLRVHRPEKFGDNMDNVRFTIVDTNTEHTSRSGFETGRIYSGLRGVVPVSAWDIDEGKQVHVGALEVGTSFDAILNTLDEQYDLGVGILLTMDHISSAMWPDFVKKRFGDAVKECDCVYEASTRNNFNDIILKGYESGFRFRDSGTRLLKVDESFFAVSHFPLRDYLGVKDPTREDVGAIIFWRNADIQVATLEETHFFNVLYGIFGYLLVEVLLFFGFRFAINRLEKEVLERTVELRTSKNNIERQAVVLAKLAENEAALNEKLKYEVGVKNRFFSIISHDLKSPFTSLLGMTHMMSEMADSFSKEKLAEYATNVNEAGDRVFELLQNLLEWSRLQMEGGKFEPQIISLTDLANESISVLNYIALEKNILLTNSISKDTAYADRDMVLTVIRNLISNSLKFTPPGGKIELLSSRQEGMVRVTVSDTGVGISKDQANKIFALDQKTSTVGTAGEKGTGLGLPLCKEMIEKNGGRIWVESIPDEGSKFHFVLPIEPGEI